MLVRKITGFSPVCKNQQNFGKKNDEYFESDEKITDDMLELKRVLSEKVKQMSPEDRIAHIQGIRKNLDVLNLSRDIAECGRKLRERRNLSSENEIDTNNQKH